MRRLLACLLLLLAWPLAAAERVVSLAPSLSEIMLELDAGDLLVGLLDGGERPAALAHVPSVGRYGQLEMETLLGLEPDLVLLAPGSVPPAQQEQLRRLGFNVQAVAPRSLAQLGEAFEQIGQRIGRPEQGRQLAARFRQGLGELRQRYRREQPVTVLYQVWHKPLYTIGGGQIISDALEVCGARNAFAELRQPAPQIGVEAVLARDPQVILGGTRAELDIWKAWPQLYAVRRGQVWEVPDKGLERPSFQMLGALEQLCRVLAKAR
ncbi:cobalamin-binding protein [Zestomonas carbonaria]|uniref:Vitamin B12-binding protein n=1 Tax=Zestomonas carbonaria TaxID=2762745 RepID=A0A7U7ENC4_9GAMM|nr:cobalamin-binding protein [Pseudomonas carbonaria]CAD5108224.1 Vitamin B12-binding protein [Pseudomonas carbonaria]